MEILKVTGLTKNFGSLQAVGGVNLSVRKNEIRAIIGPNGAGKTTFFNLVSGDLKPDGGEVFFKGQPVHGVPRTRLCAWVWRSFPITHIFPAFRSSKM
jgi:branched-chain amino acid transport system ATP-binding protein